MDEASDAINFVVKVLSFFLLFKHCIVIIYFVHCASGMFLGI